MATVDEIFMSIPAVHVHGHPEQSFEEVRIEDYLKAYTTTGRPPLPCPPEPTDEAQRALSNLPPLFKPRTERSTPFELPTEAPTAAAGDPSKLPEAQEFNPTPVNREIHQSISLTVGYTAFSHEELRHYAYLRGNKVSPTPIRMSTFVSSLPDHDAAAGTREQPTPNNSVPSSSEVLWDITCQPKFSRHSVEELRVAFLQAGKELNSDEIFGVLPPLPGASVFLDNKRDVFSTPTAVRPF